MFKAVARIGTNIGVFDTEDCSVEFHDVKNILTYLSQGITIEGVSVTNGVLTVNPVKVVVNSNQVIYNGVRVFEAGRNLRKENATTYSLSVSNKRVKFRVMNNADRYSNNYLVRMSNGIFTILPKSMLSL